MKLVIGLGNPGNTYLATRHNAGFMAVDHVDETAQWRSDPTYQAEIARIRVDEESVLLAKPQTFMNLSGDSVRLIASYYKIDPQDILIVHDDMDIPPRLSVISRTRE